MDFRESAERLAEDGMCAMGESISVCALDVECVYTLGAYQ